MPPPPRHHPTLRYRVAHESDRCPTAALSARAPAQPEHVGHELMVPNLIALCQPGGSPAEVLVLALMLLVDEVTGGVVV